MKLLLEINDLGVVYKGRGRRTDKVALDGVSVSIQAGETLGLVGESGSGKSTLGSCVLGLVQPAQGAVIFDGQDITRASGKVRRELSTQIQAVFQDPYSSFNPHRTIEQSVGESLTSVPRLSRGELRSRVVSMLERVGLDRTALPKFPPQFSGGQRQRIAIARALLPEPRLVVCDESVSALDLSVQAQVLNLLLELQRELGVAYLFITHDLAVVRHMSNQIAVLEHGTLVEHGDAIGVTDFPTQPYTRRLLRASPQSDPDVQDARRRTRRAIAGLSGASAAGPVSGVDILRALESQAVAESMAETSAIDTTVFETALTRLEAEPVDSARVVELRAAIPEMAARTRFDGIPDSARSAADTARLDLCAELTRNGRTEGFADRCRALSSAIKSGDRERAMDLVAVLDDSDDSAPIRQGSSRGQRE
ncbi:ATP-binding cassette domain-containing protein [Brevibacterium sp.]|uniref:ATP-binding cassette domain-containing protein n=1 Tax=Brevibacterium sp. TaxID=1701 RepID=UPI002811CC55|nr:ATP-binding cassette domain-containing protein [Brevibacterium sp.]